MQALERFRSDEAGTAATLFALLLVPLLGFAGAAIDFSSAVATRSALQRAADATALVLVRDAAARATDDQLATKGRRAFAEFFPARSMVALDAVQVSRVDKTVQVSVQGAQRTTVSSLLGISAIPVGVESQAAWGANRIELALVLDNTGSMDEAPGGVRKMDALKNSAKNLLRTLRGVAYEPDTVKVSVVPFDTEVRLPANLRNESWLRFDSPAERAAWTGYVIDRDQPYDVTDDAASPGDRATLYRTLGASQWASKGDLATIRPLVSLNDFSAYDALANETSGAINAMRPRGNTDVALGVAWGLATLSPGAPFTEAAPAGTRGVKRFMIVLTDGTNTQNHENGKVNTNTARIDARTRLACDAARANVTVYTIRLVDGNAGLLQDCASSPDKFRDVRNPADLSGVFQSIVNEITGTVLSH